METNIKDFFFCLVIISLLSVYSLSMQDGCFASGVLAQQHCPAFCLWQQRVFRIEEWVSSSIAINKTKTKPKVELRLCKSA